MEFFNGIDFSTWPVWAILIVFALLSFREDIRKLVTGWTAEQGERSDYERARQTWREDNTFDMLKSTLEWLQETSERQLAENAKQRRQNQELINVVTEHSRRLAQNTDILRILSQQSAQVEDRLRHVEYVIEKEQWEGGKNETISAGYSENNVIFC